MPVWQVIYEELKKVNPNFEIISFAQDSGGESDAGPILDAANVTYTSVIDTNHHISALYNLVNVPSAVWVDEEGKIVRINEGTYAQSHGAFGTDEYLPIVRDWQKTVPTVPTCGMKNKSLRRFFNAQLKQKRHSLLLGSEHSFLLKVMMKKQNNIGALPKN